MKEDNEGNIPFYIALAVFFIFSVLGLTYMLQNSTDFTERGTFGDMFGFANAMFTGFSVVGLLYTILLQRKDINKQREDLKKQTDFLHVQNFENTFFQMLNLFNSIIESTEMNSEGRPTERGRKVFNLIREFNSSVLIGYWRSSKIVEEEILENGIELAKQNITDYYTKEYLANIYDKTYSKYGDILGHYFRTYYHIIKLIDRTDGINKQQYISIARAQLSKSEQILLFFNCLHSNGKDKFKPLVEEYHLLHNIDSSLLESERYLKFYAESAYN